jgi:hypothetical protein
VGIEIDEDYLKDAIARTKAAIEGRRTARRRAAK